MTTIIAPPDTHRGEPPEADPYTDDLERDDDVHYCHLYPAAAVVTVCGRTNAWGTGVEDPDARRDPCSCGLARCLDCEARS